MWEKILQLLRFRCRHRKMSKPFTAAAPASSSDDWEAMSTAAGHYVVCLDCGRKFRYDWAQMRVVR